jgi:hypothetical protein
LASFLSLVRGEIVDGAIEFTSKLARQSVGGFTPGMEPSRLFGENAELHLNSDVPERQYRCR